MRSRSLTPHQFARSSPQAGEGQGFDTLQSIEALSTFFASLGAVAASCAPEASPSFYVIAPGHLRQESIPSDHTVCLDLHFAANPSSSPRGSVPHQARL
jgi:hypothetical protein